ncbi:MAG TPA: class I SAM-dependent methyltransferase [Gemmatimonadales bacterium]|nr:class I SAM-dependent methyltransferase [Gemmatimonadales bacterium]
MTTPQSVSSDRIKDLYNTTLRTLPTDYITFRWDSNEVQRRHYQHTHATIVRHMQTVPPGGTGLEIGCGPAVWTELLMGGGRRMTLLDISSEMLDQARARLGDRSDVSYVCGDFVTCPTPAEAPFDLVASFRAFEYMPDKQAAIGRLFALVKPGGHLRLITKNSAWRDHQVILAKLRGKDLASLPTAKVMQADVRHWTEVSQWCREAGFAEVAAYPAIVGSYDRPYRWQAGLALCDFLHRRGIDSPIPRWLDPLVESYMITARRPVA